MGLRTLLAAAFILACGQAALAQGSFPWEEYKSRTLAELVKRNASEPPGLDPAVAGKTDIVFSADPQYSQVRVTYTGTTRKVPPARRAHLEEWGKVFGLKPEIVALYESEMLVVECATEQWVPVQRQVMLHFDKELKKGDMVTLYTMFAGGRKIEGSWNWFFLVNEFQAYR